MLSFLPWAVMFSVLHLHVKCLLLPRVSRVNSKYPFAYMGPGCKWLLSMMATSCASVVVLGWPHAGFLVMREEREIWIGPASMSNLFACSLGSCRLLRLLNPNIPG